MLQYRICEKKVRKYITPHGKVLTENCTYAELASNVFINSEKFTSPWQGHPSTNCFLNLTS
jgi:hypothetical protein